MDSIDNPSWMIFTYIAVFNTCDTIGRFLTGSFLGCNRKLMLSLCYIRTILLVTTVLCAYKASPAWLFDADWFRMVNCILMGITNGLFGSVAVVFIPMSCDGP